MKPLDSPEFSYKRKALLGLIITNSIIYGAALIPLVLNVWNLEYPIISIPIILFYNILEVSLFFGCQAYNWPCTLTFRILWVLHDFSYFITYGASIAYFYLNWEPDVYYCDFTSCIDHPYVCEDSKYLCKEARSFPFAVSSSFFFLVTFSLGIAILVVFSRFPKYGCCGPSPQVQPAVVNVNGQTYQMQITPNQSSYASQARQAPLNTATMQTTMPVSTVRSTNQMTNLEASLLAVNGREVK